MEKKLIYWVAMPTEVEYDIYMLSKLTKKFDIRICTVGGIYHSYGIDINFNPYYNCDIDINSQTEMFKKICTDNPDLVIKKGGWGSNVDLPGHPKNITFSELKLFSKIMDANNIKNCIWCCEQGSERLWQMEQCKPFNWVVVNNKEDEIYYKQQFPNKKISYMPFGCVPEFHKKTQKNDKYSCLVCNYSNPRWDLSDKTESCKNMILSPTFFLEPSEYALFGKNNWYPHDLKKYYRGEFPYKNFSEVNSSCDIVLGITSNAKTGGYGTKLAKMLSCGTFVLWHYTKGIENDFENHKHLVWSKNAWQTSLLIRYYLNEENYRNKIALEGQKYAHEHLSYEKNIMKLLEEL